MMLNSSRPCYWSRVGWWISPCWARVVIIEKTSAPGRAMSIPCLPLSHLVSPRRLWTLIMAHHVSHGVDAAPHRPRRHIVSLTLVLRCLLLVAIVVRIIRVIQYRPSSSILFFFSFSCGVVDWFSRRETAQAPGILQQTRSKSIR